MQFTNNSLDQEKTVVESAHTEISVGFGLDGLTNGFSVGFILGPPVFIDMDMDMDMDKTAEGRLVLRSIAVNGDCVIVGVLQLLHVYGQFVRDAGMEHESLSKLLRTQLQSTTKPLGPTNNPTESWHAFDDIEGVDVGLVDLANGLAVGLVVRRAEGVGVGFILGRLVILKLGFTLG